jgi:hypothetical protein
MVAITLIFATTIYFSADKIIYNGNIFKKQFSLYDLPIIKIIYNKTPVKKKQNVFSIIEIIYI